jgi:anti-anti-sigma regulatory factor
MNELKYDHDQNNAMIFLEGPATIQNTLEIKNLFTEAVEKSNRIIINQENVDEFDLTYLQMLVSARKSALEAGKVLNIIGCGTESFNAIVKNSGFPLSVFNCIDQQESVVGGNADE